MRRRLNPSRSRPFVLSNLKRCSRRGWFNHFVGFQLSVSAPLSIRNASTSGGASLTVTGINFGLSGLVSIGSVACPTVTRSHTQITCTVPAGQGADLSVVVTTLGRPSPSAAFSYLPPVIKYALLLLLLPSPFTLPDLPSVAPRVLWMTPPFQPQPFLSAFYFELEALCLHRVPMFPVPAAPCLLPRWSATAALS